MLIVMETLTLVDFPIANGRAAHLESLVMLAYWNMSVHKSVMNARGLCKI